jgi:adenosine deaminase
LRAVAHAGEEGDASLVARTIDALGVSRIDHGVRAADDPAVMRRLVQAGITLTACPSGYIADNYRAITAALGLNRADLGRLAANAITGSFATDARKEELLVELARAIAD